MPPNRGGNRKRGETRGGVGGGNNQGNVQNRKNRDNREANTGLTAAGEATISKKKKVVFFLSASL